MKSLKLAAILTALFVSCTSNAVHIVTVKTETIVKESKRGLKIQKSIADEQRKLAAPFEKLEAEIKDKEAKLIEKQKALAKEDENFKGQASLLSPEARADKYDELQKKHRDLDEEVADFQRSMRKAHEDAKKVDQKLEAFYRKEMMAFEQEIKNVIEDIAKAEGWDIVLAKETVIFASEATDKTEKIIKELDKKEDKRSAPKSTSDSAKTKNNA
ncbi:MAG: OmpH family outer membrane protein [Candidatus Dependentiae bacterium]|nr:OmpH family outer membrane protein [Candidatus Dependentiae bacterium]